jgi:hypothetical protein
VQQLAGLLLCWRFCCCHCCCCCWFPSFSNSTTQVQSAAANLASGSCHQHYKLLIWKVLQWIRVHRHDRGSKQQQPGLPCHTLGNILRTNISELCQLSLRYQTLIISHPCSG